MKTLSFVWRRDLSEQAIILRIYRWCRARGHQVRPKGRFARMVSLRAAARKPGADRLIATRGAV